MATAARNISWILISGWFSFTLIISAHQYPFQNTSLSWWDRIDDLVDIRLSIEELVEQGMARYSGMTPAIPHYGIKPYPWINECLRGLMKVNATPFQQAIGLSSSFSRDLLHDVAEAVATEARSRWNEFQQQNKTEFRRGLTCYSPVINLHRHPLWGRNQETYGEDPYLTGQLAKAYVFGMQGQHPRYVRAAATCKHFDVHGGPENIPESRYGFNSVVSQRDWHMTFLPAFKTCVTETNVIGIMCSYNSINGIPACANKELLTNILRYDWNFKGYVTSDAQAVENVMLHHNFTSSTVDTAAVVVNAGVSMEIGYMIYPSIPEAIKQGKLTEKTFREAMKKTFYPRFRIGEFDPPAMNPYSKIKPSGVIQSRKHRELAIRSATMSMVLLKNMNNTLPLNDPRVKLYKRIAVVGPMIDNLEALYGDYKPNPMPEYAMTPLAALAQMSRTTYNASGCADTRCNGTYDGDGIRRAVSNVELVFVCLGTGDAIEGEMNDRKDLALPGNQLTLLKDVVNYAEGSKVILLLFNGGPLDIAWAKKDDRVSAILECWFPAQSTGEALRRILTAKGPNRQPFEYVPAARLTTTWPTTVNQIPPITNYTMEGRTYRYYKEEPLYPFGYGLSYSKFRYISLDVSPRVIWPGQDVRSFILVQNLGPYPADEVVQVYMSWMNASLPSPRLQLVGFERVSLALNETKLVVVEVAAESMKLWSDTETNMVFSPGTMQIYAGGQQPHQQTKADSNVLSKEFTVMSFNDD